MEKIIEYKTVQASCLKFDKEISELLKAGFQPYGSPFALEGEDTWTLCQAMVRYESDAPHPVEPPTYNIPEEVRKPRHERGLGG
jgi:hypothetical protein